MLQMNEKALLDARIPGEETGITVKTGICGFCGGKCFVDLYIKDGKVVKIEGNNTMPGANGRICVKGAAMKQALYNPKRLLYPMKRVGARGEGKFERISWEEALDTIAEKMLASRKQYGPDAALFYVGHPKWFRYQLTELANGYGTPNMGTESSTCAYAVMLANQTVYGTNVRMTMPDLRRCGVLVAWGANAFHSNPVTQGGGLLKTLERGVKLIAVDPRCTPTTEKAHIHLRPYPGTDGALALGMARVIITEGLQAQEYIDKYTTGFEAYKEYVMTFTPEKVEELTGVPAADMIEAARLIAREAPMSIMITASPLVHNINGVQNVRAITLLSALTGSFGMPGGNMAPGPGRAMLKDTFGTPIRRVREEEDLSHEEFPAWAELNYHEMQVIRLADYIEKGGIRNILSFGMNHHMWPRVDRLEQAFDKLDFFVSADIYMTDTCKYADILLPVQPSLELDQVESVGPDTFYYHEHAVEPAGEAWSDMDILAALADRMGITLGGDHPIHNNADFMDHILQPTGLTVADLKAAPNRMLKAKNVMPPRTSEQIITGVKTPSGKIEFVSSVLECCDKPGHESLPVYHDYREKLPLDEYPLILSTGSRKPQLFHSRTYRMPWLAGLEEYPLVEVHPEDAKRFGLKEGDLVTLHTPVGSMDFVMTEYAAALRGTVNIYHGAGEKDINYIFDDNYLDPISGFPGFKSYCCRLEKKER